MKYKATFLFTLLFFLVQTSITASGDAGDYSIERGFLGIRSEKISPQKAKALKFNNVHGNYVREVLPNTAAENAGIQIFDYIYGIDEQRANNSTNLVGMLSKYQPGDKVIIHLIRKGKALAKEVTLGRPSDAVEKQKTEAEDPFFGINRHQENSEDKAGVRIYVVSNSTASEMGLQDGDLILSINGYPMIDWSDITVAIDHMQVGEKIRVAYERDGKKSVGELPIKSYAASRRQAERPTVAEWSPDNYAFLGIRSADISDEKAHKLGFDNLYGSYVEHVIRNTAAEKAGVQVFDYIYGIEEYRTGEDQSLGKIIRKFQPDDKVTLHLIRKGSKNTLPVSLGHRSDAVEENRDKCEEPFLGIRNSHRVSSDQGVSIEVIPNSTAKEIGLKNNDIITKINGHRMIDWTDITIAIDNMKVGKTISVEHLREGNSMISEGPIKSYCDTKIGSGGNVFSYTDEDSDHHDKRDGVFNKKEQNKRDLSGMTIALQELPVSESDNLRRQHGLDLDLSNNLNVLQLRVRNNSEERAFQLEFQLPGNGETTVRVFNNTGRMVYSYELGQFSGHFSDELDIAQNGPGDYILEIRQNSKSFVRKLSLKKG